MKLSQLKIYSVGVVAVNKLRSSKVIEATPIEAVNQSNGELTDNLTIGVVKGQDSDGTAFEATVKGAATVPATWFPLGSPNRTTAPDVRRGERVILWEFGDTNEYFWTTYEGIDKYRKLETIIFAITGTRVEADAPTAENTYFFEISTHDKRVHFHTSKADGEPYTYDMLLDTANGIFQFKDDLDNIAFLNTKEKQWALRNADGSFIEINKKIININAVDEINMFAGKHIYMKAEENFIHGEAGRWIRWHAHQERIELEAPTRIGSKTAHFDVQAPLSSFSGHVTVGRGMGIRGFVSSNSGSSWGGRVSAPNYSGKHR